MQDWIQVFAKSTFNEAHFKFYIYHSFQFPTQTARFVFRLIGGIIQRDCDCGLRASYWAVYLHVM